MCNKDIKATKGGSRTVTSGDGFQDANFVLGGLTNNRKKTERQTRFPASNSIGNGGRKHSNRVMFNQL